MPAPGTDYEAAWAELEALILSRDGWGKKTLVTEMAHLRVKHQFTNQSEDPSSAGGATTASVQRDGPGTTARSEEDHDGRRREDHRRSSRLTAA